MASFNLPVNGRLDFEYNEETGEITLRSYDSKKQEIKISKKEMTIILTWIAEIQEGEKNGKF